MPNALANPKSASLTELVRQISTNSVVSSLNEELYVNDNKQLHRAFDEGTSAKGLKNSNSKLTGQVHKN
jgi:hypothetical protein